MASTIPRGKIFDACARAIILAEKRYSKWTPGGVTMRSAPESLVQTMVAEQIAKLGAKLLIEASVKSIQAISSGKILKPPIEDENGLLDLAVYYKSGEQKVPRFIIEIKKVTEKSAMNADRNRIRKLLKRFPKIQNGILVGYTTAAKSATATSRLRSAGKETNTKIRRWVGPRLVNSKYGVPRYLVAAIYMVNRPKRSTK